MNPPLPPLPPLPPRLDRRTAIKWMLTASAGLLVTSSAARAQAPGAAPGAAAAPGTRGYGTDPELNREYRPGDVWPLTFTDAQRRAAAALCAIIIPAEGAVPSAAELRVHDFIDEWISAPYPNQQRDRPVVIDGLAWIDAESQRRFGRDFAGLDEAQAAAICDDICHAPEARPEHAAGAAFFAKFRDLAAGGFFCTPEGMKDIGYVGNTPLIEFKGPPPEVLRRLGLE